MMTMDYFWFQHQHCKFGHHLDHIWMHYSHCGNDPLEIKIEIWLYLAPSLYSLIVPSLTLLFQVLYLNLSQVSMSEFPKPWIDDLFPYIFSWVTCIFLLLIFLCLLSSLQSLAHLNESYLANLSKYLVFD